MALPAWVIPVGLTIFGAVMGAEKEKRARKQARELQRQMEEAQHQADLKGIEDMTALNEAKIKFLKYQKEAYGAAQFQTGTAPGPYFQMVS
ncbi:MAG: hypothetical protein HWN68_16625 [Desulfobacterales bacterium]|nr:hypothetical protein [Desulfobacterales bacterium]